MASKRSGFIKKIKAKLTFTFQIVDITPINFYLGLKVDYNKEEKSVKLSQPTYIEKIFWKFFLDQAYLTNILIKKSTQLFLNNERITTKAKQEKYQKITKSLLFSIVKTRPDIVFAISQYTKNPSYFYIKAIKTILKYLKSSKN